ncbi:hypothetical protein SNEBB_010687 [Seison nebaliae]|nr:hypothetical protein SNEBB_010687 [Seison nebaliae]
MSNSNNFTKNDLYTNELEKPVKDEPTITTNDTPQLSEEPKLMKEDKLENDSNLSSETDHRSICVRNVEYSSTADELEKHFHHCGNIVRVTIPTHREDHHPKGFAYIEFEDKTSVNLALEMDDSLFKGRQIKVVQKRTNKPGFSRTSRPGRSRYRNRGGMSSMLYPLNSYIFNSFIESMGYMGGRGRGRGRRAMRGGRGPY